MARPTKPKDLKPKTETEIAPAASSGGGGGGSVGLDIKFIITIAAIVISSLIGSAASVYFLSPLVMKPMVSEIAKSASTNNGDQQGAAQDDQNKVGMNLELDEFMVNLKEDPAIGGNQYLRAKLSMNISVPKEEDCYHLAQAPMGMDGDEPIAMAAVATTPAENDLRGEAAPSVDSTLLAEGSGKDALGACLDQFKNNMAKYVPTMRDVINAALMKRTAGTLSTLEGQEALKDEIKEEINQFMDQKYQVLRVNFEDFIIQR